MTNPNFLPPPPPPIGGAMIEPGAMPQQPGAALPTPVGPPEYAYAPARRMTAEGVAQGPLTWWNLLRACFSGDPARITDAALGSSSGGSTHWPWLFASVANGALVGLSIMITMARLSSEFGYYFAPDASEYFAAFLIPVACAVALIAARAGAIAALFAVQKRTIAFKDAAALASTAFVVAAPLLAVALVLSLIPGTFALVVLVLAATFTAFYAEIALYVAVARVGRFAKSPALPHAVLSAAWLCVMSFIVALMIKDLSAGLLGALGAVL